MSDVACYHEYCPDYDDNATDQCGRCGRDGPPCQFGVRGEQHQGDPDDCRCARCAERRYEQVTGWHRYCGPECVRR